MVRLNRDMRLWNAITLLITAQGTVVSPGVIEFGDARFLMWDRVVITPEFTVTPEWQHLHFKTGTRDQFVKWCSSHGVEIIK